MRADGYCTLDEVRRILRVTGTDTAAQRKIRFSDECWSRPQGYSENSGSGALLGISYIDGEYSGFEFWHIDFVSSTEFILYRGQDKLSPYGNGDINTNFVSNLLILSIEPSKWTGSFQIGDKFKFETNAQMSNSDAYDFIVEAAEMVRIRLNARISSSNLPELMANPNTVPAVLRIATRYWAAYLIYTSIFSESSYSTIPPNVRQWRVLVDSLLSRYEESIDIRLLLKDINYPRYLERELLIEKVGIPEAAGVEGFKGEVQFEESD